jgi:dephospho-CoA kinase
MHAMTADLPYLVGLTGGIGSGKSAAADRFAERGATVIDTDLIAHALTGPGGPLVAALGREFGDGVIAAGGALDRKTMRDLAFSDPDARRRLEGILHPAIRAESERLYRLASTPYVVLVVPLLLESGHYRARCNRICVVDCDPAVQVSRVMSRSGLDEAQVRAIIAAQASREARLAIADDVIDNSRDLEALHAQVDLLHERYLAASPRSSRHADRA